MKKFDLTLKDGSTVNVTYKYFSSYGDTVVPHIEFHGNCLSETGYQSWFPGMVRSTEIADFDAEIEILALKGAEKFRAEHIIAMKKKQKQLRKAETAKLKQMVMF